MSEPFVRRLLEVVRDPDTEFFCVREVRGWRVILVKERGDEWVTALVPDLPYCMSQGRTLEEALRNVEEAIELHLEAADSGAGGPGEGRGLPT